MTSSCKGFVGQFVSN
uniref:Uncharacterized protein n=1 Tax=Anguilla anguilla TaxID=7936 RepID=A0A0E9PWA5_ANGAN